MRKPRLMLGAIILLALGGSFLAFKAKDQSQTNAQGARFATSTFYLTGTATALADPEVRPASVPEPQPSDEPINVTSDEETTATTAINTKNYPGVAAPEPGTTLIIRRLDPWQVEANWQPISTAPVVSAVKNKPRYIVIKNPAFLHNGKPVVGAMNALTAQIQNCIANHVDFMGADFDIYMGP